MANTGGDRTHISNLRLLSLLAGIQCVPHTRNPVPPPRVPRPDGVLHPQRRARRLLLRRLRNRRRGIHRLREPQVSDELRELPHRETLRIPGQVLCLCLYLFLSGLMWRFHTDGFMGRAEVFIYMPFM